MTNNVTAIKKGKPIPTRAEILFEQVSEKGKPDGLNKDAALAVCNAISTWEKILRKLHNQLEDVTLLIYLDKNEALRASPLTKELRFAQDTIFMLYGMLDRYGKEDFLPKSEDGKVSGRFLS